MSTLGRALAPRSALPAGRDETEPGLGEVAADLVVIGGGPAGLMAADVASAAGVAVTLCDAMPSLGRKFLLAGKGGLNLTNAEDRTLFVRRYGRRQQPMRALLEQMDGDGVRRFVAGLGIDTFVGSSGRIFPAGYKAAPLLRAWLRRLRGRHVDLRVRHRWCGWDAGGALRFATPAGVLLLRAPAVVLALGGGSWARLGSDGAWVPLLRGRGVNVAPLEPSNCGFDMQSPRAGAAERGWSAYVRDRYAGAPVKPVVVSCVDPDGTRLAQQGEVVITATGLEGGAVYALSAVLRETIAIRGRALLSLDLAPARDLGRLTQELARPRGSRSLATHLRRATGIAGVKAALLRELLPGETFADPAALAAGIKALPCALVAPRPLDEAISSAGGILFEELDEHLMVRALPGVFCAGEMIDWEAPTGGYLLTACFASGALAGAAAADWLRRRDRAR